MVISSVVEPEKNECSEACLAPHSWRFSVLIHEIKPVLKGIKGDKRVWHSRLSIDWYLSLIHI